MTQQKMLSCLRKAVTDYSLISDGDNIAVGISGGKDSIVLLKTLKAYQRFSPKKFTLTAITIDLGFEGFEQNINVIEDFCASIAVPHRTVKTDIAKIVFDIRAEKNPCSLCSKMRRGELCRTAAKAGCNKLALGHHSEDLIQTFILSMFFEGRLSTFLPKSYMDRTGITVIRPLIYAAEKDIRAFSKQLPVTDNPCPADKNTRREYVKKLLDGIEKDVKGAKKNMFSALTSPDRYNLFDKTDE